MKKKFERTHFNVMCEGTKYAFNIPENIYINARKGYAMTKECMIKKYGEEDGTKRWDDYVEKQHLTKSFDYMCEVYGKEKTIAINKSKAVTLENFIKKYGEEDGTKRWKDFCSNRSNFYSNISQRLFDKIDKYIRKKYTTFYATKNNEKCILLSKTYMLDYYIQELKICIEFNGIHFHADPRVFLDEDHCNPFNKNITAKEIRENDERRYKELFESAV